MTKRFLIASVLLVLLAGGIVGFNLFKAKMIAQFFATMKPAPVVVSVSEAVPGRWEPGIETIATASAARGTDLAVEAPGIVRDILFKANDRVTAGQVLLQIDDRQERADLAAAQAAANLAETALKRAQELRDKGVSASSALDQAEAAAIESRATVTKIEAALSTKQLTAPFAGTIGIPQVDVGSFVAAGTPFATLQDRSAMRVDFTLTEQQAALVAPGMEVRVRTEMAEGELTGTITGIEPKIDANSRLVTLRAEIPEAGDTLTPGQFLRLRVRLPVEEGVIALPQTAVASNLYGDSVYVVREETPDAAEAPVLVARQVFVKIGRRSGDRIEILEGVLAGDKVVNAGQNKLSPGATVTLDNALSPEAQPEAAN